MRALICQDPEAVFAAACVNVQAGYFDDPPELQGAAHFLEHALHLGSAAFPDERDYKLYLAKHGGASNASTSESCCWAVVAHGADVCIRSTRQGGQGGLAPSSRPTAPCPVPPPLPYRQAWCTPSTT